MVLSHELFMKTKIVLDAQAHVISDLFLLVHEEVGQLPSSDTCLTSDLLAAAGTVMVGAGGPVVPETRVEVEDQKTMGLVR